MDPNSVSQDVEDVLSALVVSQVAPPADGAAQAVPLGVVIAQRWPGIASVPAMPAAIEATPARSGAVEDERTAIQHIANLECALLSEVEPLSFETKLYCIETVRAKVVADLTYRCHYQFDALRCHVGWQHHRVGSASESKRDIADVLNVLKDMAARLLEPQHAVVVRPA